MSSNIFIQKLCRFCNSEYTARTTVTKFCSAKCAKKAYKLKLKNSKIEVVHMETSIAKKQLLEPLKEKEFLSIDDTSKLLGISRTTIWRLVKNKRLKVAKLGSRSIFRKSDIDTLFN